MRKIFKQLIGVEEARERFYSVVDTTILDSEEVLLRDALDRVLASDILSPVDVPPFDRAAMDGYAVFSKDLIGAEEDNPIILQQIGSVGAGHVYDGRLNSGECIEISTGAPLPLGADAVVMVEFTSRENDTISIFQSITPTTNVMYAGADIKKKSEILHRKQLITSREIAVLAAMGINAVPVIRRLKVGIFSSGDEIQPVGTELTPGKLYDINANAISATLIEEGAEPVYLGIIDDNYVNIEDALRSAIPDFDLLIISGGTSAGMGDILYQVLDDMGNPGLIVHGIKVKPGKPTILAQCEGTPIIGLPGYPASALSIFRLFVQPFVLLRSGRATKSAKDVIRAKTRQRLKSVMGRYEFKPVNLILENGEYILYPVPGGSGAITSIAKADGFVEIPENQVLVEENTVVDVGLISKKVTLPDIQIIGAFHPIMDDILSNFRDKFPQYSSRYISATGTAGVSAIRRGEAHLALINVIDDKGVYNSWVTDTIDAELIPGFTREVGLVVNKGNPQQIFNIKDLCSDNIRYANQKPGSSLRLLIDQLIQKVGLDTSDIKGYDVTMNPTQLARLVQIGNIDVYFGSDPGDDFDFISLRLEQFDFLINSKYADKPAMKELIAFLKTYDIEILLKG